MKISSLGIVSMLTYNLAQTAVGCEELFETPQSVLQELLPPMPFWNDTKSVQDFVVLDSDMTTPVEASNFTETATYQEVTDFFTKLAADSPYVQVSSIATMANGEELWLVTVSGEQTFAPGQMTKPIVYATAGIHPGESSGVNAGMMFVRNLVQKEELQSILESINFLFVPIMNVQGYLRQSTNGRINQHGPNTSGRRANGSWKNLNRDFGKLDTPEVRAVVGVMRDYNVSFYTDLHSTDGVSYQPDLTWCDNGDAGLSNEIFAWLRSEMQPDLESFLETEYNHMTGVCYYANDNMDPTAGYYPYFSDGAAFSTNYADHRQIPSYLLEMFSLKPNKQRVLGAYAFLYGICKIVVEKNDSLQAAIDADRAARVDPVPIAWDYDDPPPMVEWPIFEYEIVTNPVLGIEQMVWTDIPLTITVEQSTRSTPLNPPRRPFAYVIPAVWDEVIERMAVHGIQMEIMTGEATIDVVNYRVQEAALQRLREGRPIISGGDTGVPENCTRTYKKNDVVVKTDQPLGTLAVALLEPIGESSFFSWGFFSSVLTSHEEGENYIMIPLAERMLNESAEISAEWETYKTENPSYANDTAGTIDWFFRRSAFYDTEAYVYPVGILYDEPTVTLPLEPYILSGEGGESTSTETPTCRALSYKPSKASLISFVSTLLLARMV